MRRNKWQLKFMILVGLIGGANGIPSVYAENIQIITQADYATFIGSNSDGNIIAADASNNTITIGSTSNDASIPAPKGGIYGSLVTGGNTTNNSITVNSGTMSTIFGGYLAGDENEDPGPLVL